MSKLQIQPTVVERMIEMIALTMRTWRAINKVVELEVAVGAKPDFVNSPGAFEKVRALFAQAK
jgi:hypothetical protein